MRVVYLSCAVLFVAIASLTGNDAAPVSNNKSTEQQTTLPNPAVPVAVPSSNKTADVTTPVPVTNNSDAHAVTKQSSTATGSTGTTTAEPSTEKLPPATSTTLKQPPTTEKPLISTAVPSTNAKEPTNVKEPTNITGTTNGKETTNAAASSTTTAVPPMVMEAPAQPPDSKERHFDGLSFLGGIILAICLMAIGVFSWKFYNTCNERNYRTL